MKYNNRGVALILAGVLLLSASASVFPAGEHSRRAGAELLVLRGDLDRLAQEVLPAEQVLGLQARIRGSLAALPLLLRLADQELQREPPDLHVEKRLEPLHGTANEALRSRLRTLSERYPFRATGILPATPSPRRLSLARELHQSLCAGCHDSPATGQERPAFNLFDQARALPRREFAARMLIGIRGDVLTGLGNPFTDEELAALIAYYGNAGGPPGAVGMSSNSAEQL